MISTETQLQHVSCPFHIITGTVQDLADGYIRAHTWFQMECAIYGLRLHSMYNISWCCKVCLRQKSITQSTASSPVLYRQIH